MIAHVAEQGEGRGRVVLHLTSAVPSAIAIAAAVRVARAFHSGLESLFVEDQDLVDIAALPFAAEISFSGRHRRALSPAIVERQMQAAAAALARRIRAIAGEAEVPLTMTVVRGELMSVLASACEAHGPWNVVALADPLTDTDAASLARLFAGIPDTTGLIVVSPAAKRLDGRIIALVEDIADFEAVLRTARRLQAVSGEDHVLLLLAAESDEEARTMEEQCRLVVGGDETVEIARARIEANAPAMAAELIRRLAPGFIVARYGGIVVPRTGSLRALAAILECPLFLMR